MNEQQLRDEILYNRGMIVGLRHTLLQILRSTLSDSDLQKIVDNFTGQFAIMEDVDIVMMETGAALPPSYRTGIDATRQFFLEHLTRPESSSN